MPRTQVKSERIEARVTADALSVIRQAAEMTGRSLSDFIVSAAERDAHRTIEEEQIVRLSAEDQRRFVDRLLNPSEPAPAMQRAFEHRQKLLGDT